MSAKSIAEELDISREWVGSIIHEDLACGSSPRNGSRNAWTRIFWNFFVSARNKRFPVGRDWWPWTKPGYIIMTWRQNNNQWSVRVQKPAGKVLSSISWDQDGILPIDYLPNGQNINAEYYSSLLVQLKDILKEKRREKFTKGVLFLHDNAPAHWALATRKKLAYLGFQCLDHQPYSKDQPPSDYHLFPGLKKNNWKVAIFWPTQRSLLPRWLGWTNNFFILFYFLLAWKSYSNGLRSVLSFVGSILNKSRVWSL